MKISNSGQVTRQAAPARRRGRKVGGEGFAVPRHTEAPAAGPAVRVTNLTAVEPLLGLQEVDRRNDSRARNIKRGSDILDRLDEIRHALLLGSIPRNRLESMAKMVRNSRENVADPRLVEILDEIELRAEVELAKLSIL